MYSATVGRSLRDGMDGEGSTGNLRILSPNVWKSLYENFDSRSHNNLFLN